MEIDIEIKLRSLLLSRANGLLVRYRGCLILLVHYHVWLMVNEILELLLNELALFCLLLLESALAKVSMELLAES